MTNEQSSTQSTSSSPTYPQTSEEAPAKPDVDLTKRFYLKAGTDIIASFNTSEEVAAAKKDLEDKRAQVLAEASKLTHMGKITIADRGMTHEAVRDAEEHGVPKAALSSTGVKNDSDVSVKRNDDVVRSDGEKH